jgi:allantoin racemase
VSRFRLALVNPNTSEQHTLEMVTAASAALPVGSEVKALTAPRGASAIETAAEEVIAAAEVLELVRGRRDIDAFLIACFGDPAVEAARELTDAPVVGIGEAAYRAVQMLARRFAVITTLARGVPEIESGMDRLGVRHGCVGVLPLGIPVAEQGAEFGATNEAIVAVGRRAVTELGAEALVLACGGMAQVEADVRERVGVPATNGVAFGALLAYALWRAGLRTSQVGSLAPLEPVRGAGPAPVSGAASAALGTRG